MFTNCPNIICGMITTCDPTFIDIPIVGECIEDESQKQQIETIAPAHAVTLSANNPDDEEDA